MTLCPKTKNGKSLRLIYCNQVDLTERTGQGIHEKEISSLLLQDNEIEGIYVGQKPKEKHHYDDNSSVKLLHIQKTVVGYVAYQVRLFFAHWKLTKVPNAVIFPRYAPTMIAPVLVAKLRRVPLVTRTGPTIRNLSIYNKPSNIIFRNFLNVFVSLNYRSSTRLVVVTDTIRQYVLKNYKIDPTKIQIIGNGFSPETFHILDQTPDDSFDCQIFFAGSFHKDTGVDDLVEALLQLSLQDRVTTPHILAGDGPLRAQLIDRVARARATSKILFPGRIRQEQINQFLNKAAVGVVPFNTLGLSQTGSAAVKVMEYLATGTPVLATRHADHRFIEENRLGMLCNPDDPKNMARVLQILFDSKEDFDSQRLAEYARENGVWEHSYRKIRTICFDVLKK